MEAASCAYFWKNRRILLHSKHAAAVRSCAESMNVLVVDDFFLLSLPHAKYIWNQGTADAREANVCIS